MIKIKNQGILILGLIGSLQFELQSSAKEIKIDFDAEGSFYTSPVVYLTGIEGQNPKIAIKEGIATTAGVDAKEGDFSKFTSVSFQITPKMDPWNLKIIPISSEENLFCKQLILTIDSSFDENKILLPSSFPKLSTSTSCLFKIVSLDNKNNEVTENKISFIFNYTLPSSAVMQKICLKNKGARIPRGSTFVYL